MESPTISRTCVAIAPRIISIGASLPPASNSSTGQGKGEKRELTFPMHTELVLTALKAALGQRQASPQGLMFHSDRGSQYASADF